MEVPAAEADLLKLRVPWPELGILQVIRLNKQIKIIESLLEVGIVRSKGNYSFAFFLS